MNVTLVMVQSADGITVPSGKAIGWISPEDADHFRELKSKARVLVMGKNTYDSVRASLVPTAKLRRIILTHHPKTYASDEIPGHVEFTNESPEVLVNRLMSQGYTSLILAGGSKTNRAFLEQKLITDCYITVEPRFFGSGKGIFDDLKTDVSLELQNTTKLNDQGTLVLHYRILYDH